MKALEITLFWLMTLGAGGFFVWTIRQRLATRYGSRASLTLQPTPHLLRRNHRFLVCSVLPQHH